jgi:hypothetical protein
LKHEVEVIAKSRCPGCPDITTVRLRYWRAIHAEVMTHRAFSRNASSSRAVPVEKLAKASEDMFIPRFRKNQPGMQPGGYLSDFEQASAEVIWRNAADHCLAAARELADLGVHKQWANRPLEWFGYINVLVTATDWDNFYELRCVLNDEGLPIPQDEMYELAIAIREAIKAAPAKVLKPGEWHLPYVTTEEETLYGEVDRKRMSAARCASISYHTVDNKVMTPQKAIDLCDKLLERKHYSPFEHQAMADESIWGYWAHRSLHANYQGWAQWRHFLMEAA